MAPKALAASPTDGARTTRMLLGKVVDAVGVAGSTLTEECGERVELCRSDVDVDVGEAMDVDDVDEALECECRCLEPAAFGIDRIDDTDEDVDFLPRRPADERR